MGGDKVKKVLGRSLKILFLIFGIVIIFTIIRTPHGGLMKEYGMPQSIVYQ